MFVTTTDRNKTNAKRVVSPLRNSSSKRRRVVMALLVLTSAAAGLAGLTMSAGGGDTRAQRESGPFAPFDKVDAVGFRILGPRLFSVSDLVSAKDAKDGKPYRVTLSGEGPTHEPIRVAAELSETVPGTSSANARSLANRVAAASGGSIEDLTDARFSIGLEDEASVSFKFRTNDGTPALGIVVYAKTADGKDLSLQILYAAKDAKVVEASLVPVLLDSVKVQ